MTHFGANVSAIWHAINLKFRVVCIRVYAVRVFLPLGRGFMRLIMRPRLFAFLNFSSRFALHSLSLKTPLGAVQTLDHVLMLSLHIRLPFRINTAVITLSESVKNFDGISSSRSVKSLVVSICFVNFALSLMRFDSSLAGIKIICL
jgi:hypothetical protein